MNEWMYYCKNEERTDRHTNVLINGRMKECTIGLESEWANGRIDENRRRNELIYKNMN